MDRTLRVHFLRPYFQNHLYFVECGDYSCPFLFIPSISSEVDQSLETRWWTFNTLEPFSELRVPEVKE